METWAIFFPAFLCFLSAFAGIVSMRIEYSCTYVCVFVYEYVVVDSQLVLDCHTLAVSHCGSYHKNLLLFTYPFPAPNVLCIRTRVFLVCFYILVSCSSFPFDGWFLAKYLRFSEQQHYVYKCAFFSCSYLYSLNRLYPVTSRIKISRKFMYASPSLRFGWYIACHRSIYASVAVATFHF